MLNLLKWRMTTNCTLLAILKSKFFNIILAYGLQLPIIMTCFKYWQVRSL